MTRMLTYASQCQGGTGYGIRCQNMTREASRLCYLHRGQSWNSFPDHVKGDR